MKILIIVFSFFSILSCSRMNNGSQLNDNNELIVLKSKENALTICIHNNLRINNSLIKDEISLADLFNIDDTIMLSHLPKDRIFYYYSETMCSSCIQQEMDILMKLDLSQLKKVIVLVRALELRPTYIYFKQMNAPYKVFIIDKDTRPQIFESIGSPCFFSLTENHTIANFFTPIKGFGAFTEDYFNIVFNN
jgi:hypothetical protein